MISLNGRILQADSKLQEIVQTEDYWKNFLAACELFSFQHAVEDCEKYMQTVDEIFVSLNVCDQSTEFKTC